MTTSCADVSTTPRCPVHASDVLETSEDTKPVVVSVRRRWTAGHIRSFQNCATHVQDLTSHQSTAMISSAVSVRLCDADFG